MKRERIVRGVRQRRGMEVRKEGILIAAAGSLDDGGVEVRSLPPDAEEMRGQVSR